MHPSRPRFARPARLPAPLRAALISAACFLALGSIPAAAAPLSFEVSFTAAVRTTPFTGRILVFTAPEKGPEPRMGPDWFNPQPFYAVEVKGLAPGKPLRIDATSLGFPTPPSEFPATPTRFQAVLDQAQDTWQIGTAPGNGMSAIVTGKAEKLPIKLTIDRLIEAPKFSETEQIKLAEIPSPRLTRFYGRPIHQRAAVILPEGYAQQPTKRFPVVYMIPGFGGSHFDAPRVQQGWPDLLSVRGLNALVVLLDPTAHTGHHVFADSANNGPVGTALVEEMVPYIDRTYRTLAKPTTRLLTGHSSGGWSSLWLQCTYPKVFGGVWSTSPDPVDFRDFQQINLYAPQANMFRDAEGKQRPLARFGDQAVLLYQNFSEMETVLGHGGQLQSFEAVFSPRAANGQPQPLYDRRTGAVDPQVAAAWRKYDIGQVLREGWPKLEPDLKGKLHVYTGDKDTFYLEGAVRLLKADLARLGSDAKVEVVPGKDHGSLLGREMRTRIAREMAETVRSAKAASAGRKRLTATRSKR